MKCSVCGTESKGDARFCAGCGATLIVQKADETMLDLRTALFRRPLIIPAAPPKAAAAAPAAPPPAAVGANPARSNVGGLLLVIIALAVIGYFVYQVAITLGTSLTAVLTETARPATKPAETPQLPTPAAKSAITVAEPPKAEPVVPAPVPAPTPTSLVVPAAVQPPAPVEEPQPASRAPEPAKLMSPPAPEPVQAAPAPPAETHNKGTFLAPPKVMLASQSADAPPRPAAPRTPPRAPETATSPPAVALALAPAPVPAPVPEPPRPDRWDEMKEALARCGRENFISRVVCEQKAGFQYCNGYWGKVPQCPDAQNPDPGK